MRVTSCIVATSTTDPSFVTGFATGWWRRWCGDNTDLLPDDLHSSQEGEVPASSAFSTRRAIWSRSASRSSTTAPVSDWKRGTAVGGAERRQLLRSRIV